MILLLNTTNVDSAIFVVISKVLTVSMFSMKLFPQFSVISLHHLQSFLFDLATGIIIHFTI